MDTATRVIAIRYALRSAAHESGPGIDGFVVLQEVGGTRHIVIIFPDALGTEVLKVMHQYPGEPLIAHELFVDLLRSCGAAVEHLRIQHLGDSGSRPGIITLSRDGNRVTREAGMYDIVGLSVATGAPIHIDAEVFATMHEAAPPLDILMSNGHSSLDAAEELALSDDASRLGKA